MFMITTLAVLLAQCSFIDLTQTLHPAMPTWNGSCGFEQVVTLDYHQCSGEDTFRVQKVTIQAGIGTHMDAPAHCIPGGLTIDALPLESLISPCVVIDVSNKIDAHYLISPDDVKQFEAMFGVIPQNAFVLFYTGWSRYWNNAELYRNNHVFPSIHPDTARLLLERSVNGVGIDTLSPDRPDHGFPVHRILLGAGKYIVENVAGLAASLPAVGSYSFALPIKSQGGTEAPMRLIIAIPKQEKSEAS